MRVVLSAARNMLTMLSLLICVAMVAMWVRSLRICDEYDTTLARSRLSIWSARARAGYITNSPVGAGRMLAPRDGYHHHSIDDAVSDNAATFWIEKSDQYAQHSV